jgi:hypothetical protein
MSHQTVICERLVQSDRDMLDIEKCIVGELGGENHRCAFFRTIAYIKLRIAALYVPSKAPQVVLTPTEEGSWVAVRRRFNEPLYTQATISDCEAMEQGLCSKRMRTEGSV